MKSLIYCLMVGLCLLVDVVGAHEGRPVFVELNITEAQQVELQWKIPPVLPQGAEPSISLYSKSCSSGQIKPKQALTGRDVYQCDSDVVDLRVLIEYPGANPALSSLVVVRKSGKMVQQIFSGPQEKSIDALKAIGGGEIASQYTISGVQHILAGWDHLLFVLCLLLLSRSLRGVLITISGFTIGHSVTLVLSILGVLWVPIVFVEMLIALSIVVLASELVTGYRGGLDLSAHWRRLSSVKDTQSENSEAQNFVGAGSTSSLSWRYPAVIATGFGLLHGFGFASVLGEFGLPDTQRILALFFFNIGIELGQIVFIIAVILVGVLLSKIAFIKKNQRTLLLISIYLIGLIASYWLFERLSLML